MMPSELRLKFEVFGGVEVFNLLEAATHTHARTHTLGLACVSSVFPVTHHVCS